MMKKLVAFVLSLVMLMSIVTVAGATSTYLFGRVDNTLYLDADGTAQLTYRILYNGSGKTTVTASLYDHETKKTYGAGTYTAVSGKRFDFYNGAVDGLKANHSHRITLHLKDANGKKAAITFYQTLVHSKNGHHVIQEQATAFDRNTACSDGPHFRDLRKSLTDKWYTFSVVDLTQQGTQTFELIASNLFKVGTVKVDVFGDEFAVTYEYDYADQDSSIKPINEFFTIFHDLKSVKTVDPEKIKDGMTFGKTYSIKDDLGGDTTIMLFVRNMLSYTNYPIDTVRLNRWWPNAEPYKSRHQAMLELLNNK